MYYFDNGATSFPKPESVYNKVTEVMREYGANPGRGSHTMALKAARAIYETRCSVARLFNIKDPLRVAFTANATMSLNLAINSVIESGDKIVTTNIEHNSVLRPLYAFREKGIIELEIVKVYKDGKLCIEEILKTIDKDTKAVVLNHASNVTGSILPIETIGRELRLRGILFIVDASQSAGVIDIDVEKMYIDILCFAGHKSLLGPQGTGGIYVREGVVLKRFIEGGSGSNSKSKRHPDKMPEIYEFGTSNTPAIAGLGAGIDFLLEKGVGNIRDHELKLANFFYKEVKKIPGVIVYGEEERVPVVSINVEGVDPSDLSSELDEEYGIATRPGMHCAPLVHEAMGTGDRGAVRFSFGYFNNIEEVNYAIKALKELVKG